MDLQYVLLNKMNIFKKILTAIQVSDNNQFIKVIDEKDKEINNLKEEIKTLNVYVENGNKLLDDEEKRQEILNKKILELQSQLPKETQLDTYCQENYTLIPNIAYKDKMKFNDKKYSVFLNELITPNAFEVQKFLKKINVNDSPYTYYYNIGDKVSTTLTWTDDKNLDKSGDLYLYPAQTLALKNTDCEDHSFLVSSLHKDLGVGYGFYYPQGTMNPSTRFGHAFNVFVLDNKLYCLETTGNTCEIEEYTGKGHYTINYIITRDKTYQLDGSIQFGILAGW